MKRVVTVIVVTALVGVLAYLGWSWLDGAQVEAITVRGAVHADSSQIVALAGVEVGTALMDVSPEFLADRVRRHPWVQAASASRQPTGTLVINVREREPVALALDARGVPDYYLDAAGYRMPAVPGPVVDVPIVRGVREAYHPVVPVSNPALRRFIALLPDLEAFENALLSEIHETESGIDIYTAVTPSGQSLRVRLGRDHFDQKLDRLQSFWMQAVLARPETRYDWVDLRFDGQVVTRERA
ncbi:MAG: FtsQ-type POTRA domain-containing protein [Rhodothermales bacterium]|nr:FtsQ-type POTRA domain-containing protein [Rhodothermales bacterium]